MSERTFGQPVSATVAWRTEPVNRGRTRSNPNMPVFHRGDERFEEYRKQYRINNTGHGNNTGQALIGGVEHRREWAAESLLELLHGFAIDLQAYAIMSNHIHLVLRPRPDVVEQWAADQVARVGLRTIPVRLRGYAESVSTARTNVED